MDSNDLKSKYFAFFEARGHRRLPSAPLLPENDPTALFISAGMQPLVPFLLGEPHPAGTRIANIQKCLRTKDIAGDIPANTNTQQMGDAILAELQAVA